MSNGTRLSVMSVSSQTTSSYKNCTNIKVKEALNAIKVASETYFTCSKTQPTASPTKIVASTTSGISTTERTTTPIAPTEGTPN